MIEMVLIFGIKNESKNKYIAEIIVEIFFLLKNTDEKELKKLKNCAKSNLFIFLNF